MTQRIAVIDPGSFVVFYDEQLVAGLRARGAQVDFYGSWTRYNGEFLEAMRAGGAVHAFAISQTVAPRLRGGWNYLRLLARLWGGRRRYDLFNLQFSGFWPVEWLVFGLLRRRFVFTVHNAVPHGFGAGQHAPTRRLAALARTLVFLSEATREDFMRRYGEGFRAKATLLPLGLLPFAPGETPRPYRVPETPAALIFWSSVRPYKGVDVFEELAASPQVKRRGLSLEIFGAWSGLAELRERLARKGVAIEDGYLDATRLRGLLSRNAVFLLPYQQASQSGALYTLLHHGCVFFCTDVGDLGDFMRRHGLDGLLLKDRSAQAVIDCLDHLAANREQVEAAFSAAQEACRWETLLARHGDAYGLPARSATIPG